MPCSAVCVCVCVCRGECVYGKFPKECDITQRGLLLGVLLLLPATPLPESMILHTHTLAPTEVTPTGPNFPLHLQPDSRLCICTSVCLCVCYCLPTCQPIKSMLPAESLSAGPLPLPTSQPIKSLNLQTPPLDRPIMGRSSKEGSVTWVIPAALATGIIWTWKREEVKWTFHFPTNSQS